MHYESDNILQKQFRDLSLKLHFKNVVLLQNDNEELKLSLLLRGGHAEEAPCILSVDVKDSPLFTASKPKIRIVFSRNLNFPHPFLHPT